METDTGNAFNSTSSPSVPPQPTEGHGLSTTGLSILDELDREDSLHGVSDNEVMRYVRATSNGDRTADPLIWWKLNEARFPNVANLARDVLAIQASSLSSESVLSVAGNFLIPSRSSMSDSSFRALMLLKSWMKNNIS